MTDVDVDYWQERLDQLAAEHRVPGAALGILRGTEMTTFATGSANPTAGVDATPDTVWQLGSISKVWTTTLVMTLVDEGRLDLDEPVTRIVKDLELADGNANAQVTMRHLLTHTSGIDGDVIVDTGRGDDCLEKYVQLLSQAKQIHPIDATWSYCNSGFILAGRVVELITGMTWDAALRERVIEPLGLEHTSTLPEEALLHRTACGHIMSSDRGPVRAPMWLLPRSAGPAGLVNSTVADVLDWVRLHLNSGRSASGAQVLSADSVLQMQSLHAELPDRITIGDSWGLGWIRFGWGEHRLIGHDGATLGQTAYLRVLPSRDFAITVLTNSDTSKDFFDELCRQLFTELADIYMPQPFAPPKNEPVVQLDRHAGTYERAGTRIDVAVVDGRLQATVTPTGPFAEVEGNNRVEVLPMTTVEPNLFAVQVPGQRSWAPVTFYETADGSGYVHLGGRATPRIA